MAGKRASKEAMVRRLALALPDVDEAPSYGTPGFRRKGKLFARLHQDGESLVVRADAEERDALIDAEPGVFFVTDHYRGYPWVLVRLTAASEPLLKEVLANAWAWAAPKTKAKPKRRR
jgi:hypothetical protein